MGNKHSSLTARERKVRVKYVDAEPVPPSHATPKHRRSQASLSHSWSSHETLCCEKHNHRHPSDPRPSLAYVPLSSHRLQDDDVTRAHAEFLKQFPEYRSTWILDSLRRTDFGRLDRSGETYVDYMGGAQHPESLVRVHGHFLSENSLGNTHSVSNR